MKLDTDTLDPISCPRVLEVLAHTLPKHMLLIARAGTARTRDETLSLNAYSPSGLVQWPCRKMLWCFDITKIPDKELLEVMCSCVGQHHLGFKVHHLHQQIGDSHKRRTQTSRDIKRSIEEALQRQRAQERREQEERDNRRASGPELERNKEDMKTVADEQDRQRRLRETVDESNRRARETRKQQRAAAAATATSKKSELPSILVMPQEEEAKAETDDGDTIVAVDGTANLAALQALLAMHPDSQFPEYEKDTQGNQKRTLCRASGKSAPPISPWPVFMAPVPRKLPQPEVMWNGRKACAKVAEHADPPDVACNDPSDDDDAAHGAHGAGQVNMLSTAATRRRMQRSI